MPALPKLRGHGPVTEQNWIRPVRKEPKMLHPDEVCVKIFWFTSEHGAGKACSVRVLHTAIKTHCIVKGTPNADRKHSECSVTRSHGIAVAWDLVQRFFL